MPSSAVRRQLVPSLPRDDRSDPATACIDGEGVEMRRLPGPHRRGRMGRAHGPVRVNGGTAVPYVAQLVRHVEHLGRPPSRVVGSALHACVLGVADAAVAAVGAPCPGVTRVSLELGRRMGCAVGRSGAAR